MRVCVRMLCVSLESARSQVAALNRRRREQIEQAGALAAACKRAQAGKWSWPQRRRRRQGPTPGQPGGGLKS